MALITKEEELKFLDYKNPEQTMTKEEVKIIILMLLLIIKIITK